VVDEVGHAALAQRQGLGDHADEGLGHVEHEVLHGLEELAVDEPG